MSNNNIKQHNVIFNVCVAMYKVAVFYHYV